MSRVNKSTGVTSIFDMRVELLFDVVVKMKMGTVITAIVCARDSSC